MLNFRPRLTLLLITALLTGGCGSESATAPEAVLRHGTLTARLDGAAWRATQGLQASYSNGILTFAGVDASLLTMGMAVIAAGPGTYTIGSGSPNNALISSGALSWHAAAANGTGTVTITTLNASAATGTFTFTANAVATSGATGTRTVTEGVFNLTF
jgi:hypothetical protein